MAATKRAGATGARSLPPMTVARFREITELVERLVEGHTDAFIAAGQRYRDRHREQTSRPLNAMEIGQIAAGLSTSLADARDQIEEAGLTHHDEPVAHEFLLAAGVATAPAFLTSALRIVALLEMPADTFEQARETESLDETIDEAVVDLEALELDDARLRAAAAMDYLASKTGVAQGKAWSLVARTVWQGLQQAMGHLTTGPETWLTLSSTDSPPTTTGPDETSSTDSPGLRPAA